MNSLELVSTEVITTRFQLELTVSAQSGSLIRIISALIVTSVFRVGDKENVLQKGGGPLTQQLRASRVVK